MTCLRSHRFHQCLPSRHSRRTPIESTHLRDFGTEQAIFQPAGRTGWRRSTIIL